MENVKESYRLVGALLVFAVAAGLSILIATSVANAFSSQQPPEVKSWPAGVANSISLTPMDATNVIGAQHQLTATIGVTGAGTTVTFAALDGSVNEGVLGTSDTVSVGGNGVATFSYRSDTEGTDTIVASYEDPDAGTVTSNQVTKTWVLPEAISLTPMDATNVIGAQHQLTATIGVTGAGTTVAFTALDGSVNEGLLGTSDTVSVGGNGVATFIYRSDTEGTDTIVASYEDPDAGTVTSNQVTKTWVLPEAISLTPMDATNVIGAQHQLTATIGVTGAGTTVTFAALDGSVNEGVLGTSDTVSVGGNGVATFSYRSDTEGTDTIVASYEDPDAGTVTSNQVTKTWVLPTPPIGPGLNSCLEEDSCRGNNISVGANSCNGENSCNGNNITIGDFYS